MDFWEIVGKRKSIRDFEDKPVSEEKIREILQMVRLAPSAGNLQAYKIFVVSQKEKKEKLMRATGYQEFVAQAPAVLVFCADSSESAKKYGERGKRLYSLQDATIACAYAQLAATSLGLSSCWVGAFDEQEVQKILLTSLFPVAILPLGYPAENPGRLARKEIEELVKFL